MRRSQTISVSIDRPFDEVYDYLVNPANYQYWATVEPGTFKPLGNGDWQGEMPKGLRHFRFTPPNNFGVLDHAIFVPGEELLYTPMRLVPNGKGCELTFTFFRREGMDDPQFASTVEWIRTDFLGLKSLLEARNRV
jgi:hypothetical protein